MRTHTEPKKILIHQMWLQQKMSAPNSPQHFEAIIIVFLKHFDYMRYTRVSSKSPNIFVSKTFHLKITLYIFSDVKLDLWGVDFLHPFIKYAYLSRCKGKWPATLWTRCKFSMYASNGFLYSLPLLTNMVFCYGHHMSSEYILKLIAFSAPLHFE